MNGVFNRAMRAFESVRRGDYVDKSELIIQMNRLLLTENRFVCVSRGRRFGKSVAAQMLSAYYDKDCDSKDLFEGLEAVKNESFATYLDHFPVIYLDITDYTTKYVDDTCLVKKMQSELMQEISSRYPQTQTMDFDGLKDAVIQLIACESVPVNTLRFSNDLQKISSKDDVLTILCHLGYLTYDAGSRSVRIPNYEVRQEFENSLQDTGWTSIANAVKESEQLLMAVLRGEPKPVEETLDAIHADNTSILQYNDENSLSCVLSLAFYAARGWYTMIRELPTGSGFADVVLLPKRGIDKPAILLELKWNQSADTAIRQVHEKRYAGVLKDIVGEVILVGVNYDKKTKRHKCRIEKFQGVTSRSSSQNLKEYSRSSKRQKIVDFCHEPRSLEEIAKYMKVRDKYYMKRTHINPMLGVDIFMTEPDSPNSPNQKYYSK